MPEQSKKIAKIKTKAAGKNKDKPFFTGHMIVEKYRYRKEKKKRSDWMLLSCLKVE